MQHPYTNTQIHTSCIGTWVHVYRCAVSVYLDAYIDLYDVLCLCNARIIVHIYMHHVHGNIHDALYDVLRLCNTRIISHIYMHHVHDATR